MGSLFLAYQPTVMVFHFIFALFLITVLLLQSGKGSDIGTAFGVGNSQTVFGATGASTFLSKLTTIAAVLFLITSLFLATAAKISARGTGPGTSVGNQLMQTTNQNSGTDSKAVSTETTGDSTATATDQTKPQ